MSSTSIPSVSAGLGALSTVIGMMVSLPFSIYRQVPVLSTFNW